MKPWVWLGALVLAVLHQDFWLWDVPTAVFGVLPAGLAWHLGYSLAAGLFWGLVVRYAWPPELDLEPEADAAPQSPGGPPAAGAGR